MKTIIFDLGGVLVSDAPFYYETKLCDFTEFLEWCNVSRKDAKVFWDKRWPDLKYGRTRTQSLWNDFKQLTDKNIEEVITKYKKRIIIDEELLELIKSLKGKYRLLSLANESIDGINLKIEKFQLNELFEKIYCSANLGMAKPDKDIFEHVIKDAKLDLDNTVFIDNQIENVKAARSLGITTIHFTDLVSLKEELTTFIS